MKFANFVILAVSIQVLLAANVHCRRYKRSLVEFAEIVHALTGRSALDFNGYGNWCGMGGSGPVVDEIDGCCKNHDHCYEYVENDVCGKTALKAKKTYTTKYEFMISNGQAECKSQSNCEHALCICDVTAASCFKQHLSVYNSQNVSQLGKLFGRFKSFFPF